ncbi:hypothetical protein BGW42_005336 [Actinomortierella wolfii]|nr:hypothetical protein BGW42_005336 [Actinomortierella wolfii]
MPGDYDTQVPMSPGASFVTHDGVKVEYEVITFPKKQAPESPSQTPFLEGYHHEEEEELDVELEPLPDHLITTYSPRYQTASSPTPRPKQEYSPDAKYLTFLPHSGFHNQRSELENALVLARLLNRTLIMPKVYLGPPMPWLTFQLLHERLLYQTKIGLERCRALIEHRDFEPLPVADEDDQTIEDEEGDEDAEGEAIDQEEGELDVNSIDVGDEEVVKVLNVEDEEISDESLEPLREGVQEPSALGIQREPEVVRIPTQGNPTSQDALQQSEVDTAAVVEQDVDPMQEAPSEMSEGDILSNDKLHPDSALERHHHHHHRHQLQPDAQARRMGQHETSQSVNTEGNLAKRSIYKEHDSSSHGIMGEPRKQKRQTPPKKWTPLPAECLQYESWTMTDWDLFFNLDPLRHYVRLVSRESISMTYLQEEFGLSIPLEEQKTRLPKSSASSQHDDGSNRDDDKSDHDDLDDHDDHQGMDSDDASEGTRPLLRPLGDVLFFEDSSLYDYRFTEDPQAPESLKTQSKFLQEFTVDWLAQRPERLIHLGSIFGSGRVSISKPESKAWLRMVREHLILQTDILQQTSQRIAEAMAGGSALRKKILQEALERAGRTEQISQEPVSSSQSPLGEDQDDGVEDESGFIGIHIRMSDGHFSLSARKTIENIRQELLWQMGVEDPLHLGETEVDTDYDSQQQQQEQQPRQGGFGQITFQRPKQNPIPVSAERRFSVEECRAMSLKHWTESVDTAVAAMATSSQDSQPPPPDTDMPPSTLPSLKRNQGLQTPIFLATDAHNPRANPIFANLFATFDCLFTLDDFRDELEELHQFRNPEDGVRLAPFLIPMIDAMVVAKSGAFFGTPMSTFSNYIARQLRPAYTNLYV